MARLLCSCMTMTKKVDNIYFVHTTPDKNNDNIYFVHRTPDHETGQNLLFQPPCLGWPHTAEMTMKENNGFNDKVNDIIDINEKMMILY